VPADPVEPALGVSIETIVLRDSIVLINLTALAHLHDS